MTRDRRGVAFRIILLVGMSTPLTVAGCGVWKDATPGGRGAVNRFRVKWPNAFTSIFEQAAYFRRRALEPRTHHGLWASRLSKRNTCIQFEASICV
jgi:hypothetical protein